MPDITELPWLPEPPADLSARVRALGRDTPADGATLQFLAGHRLSAPQAASLGRTIRRAIAAGTDLAPLAPFRLAILANTTQGMIADEIPAAAARHGVAAELIVPDFGQVMQEALDPASRTNASKPDAVLLAIDHRWLGLDGFAAEKAAVPAAIGRLEQLIDALQANSAATPILSLLPAPPTTLFGSYERRVAGTPAAGIEAINRRMIELADEKGCAILDVAGLAARGGTDRWFDPVQYAAYKLPFAAAFTAAYADMIGRLIGAMRGKARKCLVLDLDNTLWGGVIGDDGLAGIKLGEGSAAGEVFAGIQRMALELKRRGVILAVASKNEDATARSAFREHSEMVLRESDIAVFQANWTDKASNLEAIAATLSIGVDSLVLLDDNPAERAQLRAALPQVAVPELPADPAWFSWYLKSAGYFEAVAHSAEDAGRAGSYAANAQRAAVQATARDLGDYLSSLNMVLDIRPFDVAGRGRIAQLINKTNQFNLTTRRLTEAEVRAIDEGGEHVTIQARLADQFGDMGMIGVVTAHVAGEEAVIEDWLMSCRVLGRQVEQGMLEGLLQGLRSRGVRQVSASYRPTPKNAMVREHFDRLGFTLANEDEIGVRTYGADVASFAPKTLPMELQVTGWNGGAQPPPRTDLGEVA